MLNILRNICGVHLTNNHILRTKHGKSNNSSIINSNTIAVLNLEDV